MWAEIEMTRPDVVALGKQSLVGLCEFRATLVYIGGETMKWFTAASRGSPFPQTLVIPATQHEVTQATKPKDPGHLSLRN